MDNKKDYEREVECEYKGEKYSVRDNGTVLRHKPEGKKARPMDNVWTYGKYNKTGYAEIAGERVHRIVATAFLGPAPTPQHVVDHKDTNRKNNRPENLRWLSKLENALLNPITLRRIEIVCGSVEEFLKDPSKLRANSVDRNFEWMRAVSKEEGAICLEHLQEWAQSDKKVSGGRIGEWIYKRNALEKEINEEESSQMIYENEKDFNDEVEEKMKQESLNIKTPSKQKSSRNNHIKRDENANIKLYRTPTELINLIISLLEEKKIIRFPDLIASICGKWFVIKTSWIEVFQSVEYLKESKKLPKYILIKSLQDCVAVLFKMKTKTDENEFNSLVKEGYNVVEIDLTWAKEGVTKGEMAHFLREDFESKIWLNHKLMDDTNKRIEEFSEPIELSGNGVQHSYYVCPLDPRGVQNTDCWYCKYRLISEDLYNGRCFAKTGVETYEDLNSITDVKREDGKILSIIYDKNGEKYTKMFSKESNLGKTLLQLWKENNASKLIAQSVSSNWFVLIDIDSYDSILKHGKVVARMAKDLNQLSMAPKREVYGYDNKNWKKVNVN